MLEILALNLALIIGLLTLVWVISIPLEDVGIIDIFWGPGFIAVAWFTLLEAEKTGTTAWLMPVLVTIWGLRLATHLAFRNLGKPEDKRYRQMREKRKGFWWKSLFIVFWLQGVIMFVVSLPLQVGITCSEDDWAVLHMVGSLIWLVGLFFEAVGDWQLTRFKSRAENSGKVLDSGLWRYTRHPNYFGDFLVWWGIFIVSIGSGHGYWTIISPVVMSIFLMYVSGVTMTEKSMKQDKPEYEEYIRQTNAFFPGPTQASSS